MEHATDRQMQFINGMRQVFSDYNALIEEKYEVPDAETAWSWTKKEASSYIGKNKGNFTEAWKKLTYHPEEG